MIVYISVPDWKTVPDPKQASWLVCEELLQRNKGCRQLFLSVDIRKDKEEQDQELVEFYKKNNIQWASPLECKLRGDVATGSGVERHMFSMVIFKLISGFHIHLGGMSITKLFEGETDHLIPSVSQELLAKNMFTVAGRMIGHSFLHQGPSFSGLSLAIIHVLFGGSEETCPISIADCPDTDIRDVVNKMAFQKDTSTCCNVNLYTTISLDSHNKCLGIHKSFVRKVIEGTRGQVNQLRLGLQETGVWPLLMQRRDVIPYVFPRESETYITPQIVLDCIIWPTSVTVFFDNYHVVDDNVEPDSVDVCRVCSYLKIFIENGMYFNPLLSQQQDYPTNFYLTSAAPAELKNLLKFWIGWEKPTTEMKVEIVNASFPSASTCFEKLRLPRHYDSYNRFYQDLSACISTTYSGFGCE
ncbi:hypothetical protein NL108_001488 [Boleophthalmus pectinirostris]|nr:hypothetical protein NL108_001488 [Boleophthalmus pectinirostris]